MSKREVKVVKHGSKYTVLVNGIQRGVAYSNEALAKNEAKKAEAAIW